jgi:hypothetical protein
MPGHLSSTTDWTNGPTTFEFTVSDSALTIHQDGRLRATTPLKNQNLYDSLTELNELQWGTGIYGDFRGRKISGTVVRE